MRGRERRLLMRRDQPKTWVQKGRYWCVASERNQRAVPMRKMKDWR